MKKTILTGYVSIDNQSVPVFVTVEKRVFKDDKIEWSFVAVEWPTRDGNSVGSCGQCMDSEWVTERVRKLWKKYHLNGMSAGTKEQDVILAERKESWWKYDYSEACEILKSAGLYETTYRGKPYVYGHAWIYQSNPNANEINFFFEHVVDESDKLPPAWRD